MRLTKKKWHQLCGRKKDWFEYVPNEYSAHDRIYKLGQLEDIEEKRGISLSVLDRLLDYFDEVYIDNSDKPFYVKFLDGIYPVNPVHLQFDFRNKRLVEEYNLDSLDDKTYPFSEYGKTWALTKEELE